MAGRPQRRPVPLPAGKTCFTLAEAIRGIPVDDPEVDQIAALPRRGHVASVHRRGTFYGLVSLAALGGCTNLEEKPAAACTTYGFKPGTEAHAACTQQEVASRRAAATAAAPPLDATLQPFPRRLPVRCTPNGFGGLRCY